MFLLVLHLLSLQPPCHFWCISKPLESCFVPKYSTTHFFFVCLLFVKKMDPEARLPLDDSSSEDGWILVNEGDLKGATLMVDRNSGEVLSISTRSCRDEDRWETVPDLSRFKCLEFLDFYKSRYITEFDATVCPAPTTRKVFLTRCDNLQTISPSIEVLQNLTELNLYDSPKIGALPEEIGKLKRFVLIMC